MHMPTTTYAEGFRRPPTTLFFLFTPVLTHPKDFNKMKVKDAIISYALVKSKVNVKCEDRIMQEDQKYQIPTGKKASILFFLSWGVLLQESIAIYSWSRKLYLGDYHLTI